MREFFRLEAARNFLWKQVATTMLTIVAFAVFFFRLEVRTFHGDELWSLKTVHGIGTSLSNILYFLMLRLWSFGGTSEFWLRSLSALFAVAAVPITFLSGKGLFEKKLMFAASLLLATSPFLVVYAQQVRFYSLFLLASCVSVAVFLHYLNHPSKPHLLFLMVANMILLLTHTMAILLIASQWVTLFLLSKTWTPHQKMAATILVLALGIFLLSFQPVKEFGFNAIAHLTNAVPSFSKSKGWSLIQWVKIPRTFYSFVFGESVYPLKYELVIPGLILYGSMFLTGLWRLQRRPAIFVFIVTTGLLSLVLLYFVFDPLVPSTYASASPRYLIFLLPLFYLVVSIGASGKKMLWLVLGLILINAGSLNAYWANAWSEGDDLIDWRNVTQWVGRYVNPQTLVLLEGRAKDVSRRYFPSEWNQKDTYSSFSDPTSNPWGAFSRIIFLSSNFHKDVREQNTVVIRGIESGYEETDARSQYPLFVYVYDKKNLPGSTYRVDPKTGSLQIPKEIYGLEFQDLKLPFAAKYLNRSLESHGGFSLPLPTGNFSQEIRLAMPSRASRLVILTNMTGAEDLKEGAIVAQLLIRDTSGSSQTFSLREGYETNSWDKTCRAENCKTGYSWKKRMALLGSARYPKSWREFEARIFATELILSHSTFIKSVELVRTNSSGTLHVWGIFLEPPQGNQGHA